MIVWGGYDNVNAVNLNDGGRYTPSSNSWTATSTGTNCPTARDFHTAVWTGTEMIVWGGYGSAQYLNTGGRYTPSSNSWTATSTGAIPSGRTYHTAVWTGTEMIVWGGKIAATPTYTNTGGRYAPSSNSWTFTSTGTNCPSARILHSAVWTGTEMIVWGGNDGASGGNTGGIFYPNTPPRSVPALSTSLGGDATFTLGLGETLSLNGTASTDGSNPYTTTPSHDELDSIVLYEWDLNGDANFGTLCASSSSGVDYTGATPVALTEANLASLGITTPGAYPIWLRVTDEVGVRACASASLTVAAAPPAPGETSRQSIPAEAMHASWNKGTGQVHVTYTAACDSTGHAAYWGNLAQLSSYAWSGSQCASGSGAIDFTPPSGSIFFVIVGNNGVKEGSYGKNSAGTQRPEAIGIGACDYPQQLTGSCDP